MHQIPHHISQLSEDAVPFVKKINALRNHPRSQVRDFFDPGESIFVTRAPGRLDVMGGIADYSGSLVLELPIAEATVAALQRNDDRTLRVASLTGDSGPIAFEMPFADFEQNGEPVDYEFARKYFQNDPAQHWAAYIAGAF